MNVRRVLLGGLVAGIIINIFESVANVVVLAGPNREVLRSLGVDEPGGAAIAGFTAIGFFLGMLVAWVHAAIRPRFGPGPWTAVHAGVATWVAAFLIPVTNWALLGVYPAGLAWGILAYGFGELLCAALAARLLYLEVVPAPSQ